MAKLTHKIQDDQLNILNINQSKKKEAREVEHFEY